MNMQNQAIRKIGAYQNGREAWAAFDSSAQVWEIFASKEADDYIGCADSLQEARGVAKDWAEEWN